jgi:LysM repeat protein
VRPGDTLEVVARRYGVSVSALKAANPGARRGARSGQQLVIPER